MKYFVIIGISQGFLLSFLLIHKSFLKKNNVWLIGFFVLLITGIISGSILNDILGEPKGSFIADPLILLIGPSFYLYILSFSKTLRPKDYLLHGLVFLLYLPVLAVFYTKNVTANIPQPSLHTIYSSAFAITIGLTKFFHMFIYVFLSFVALRKHEEKIKRVFADLTGKDLTWFKYMLGAFIFLVTASLILYVLALQYPEYQNILTLVNLSLLSIFILVLSVYAFNQNSLFDYASTTAEAEEAKTVVSERAQPKYEKSGMKTEELVAIKAKIDSFIADKGYADPNLTLTTMAEAIDVRPSKISEVLGKHMGTSFYDLINAHRVEDIKKAINDPKLSHLTILSIAFDFGYNSKSTFNVAFKKFTGMTPSEFKRVSTSKSVA